MSGREREEKMVFERDESESDSEDEVMVVSSPTTAPQGHSQRMFKELETVKSTLSNMSTEKQMIAAKHERLKNEYNKLLQDFESRMKESKQDLKTMKTDLATVEKVKQQLEFETNVAKTKLDETVGVLEGYASSVWSESSLQSVFDRLKQQVLVAEKQDTLKEMIQLLCKDNQKLKSETEELSSADQTCQIELKELKSEMKKTEAEFESQTNYLVTKLDELKNEKHSIEEKLKELEELQSTTEKEKMKAMEDLHTNLIEVQGDAKQIEDFKRKMETLTQDLQAQKNMVSQKDMQLGTLNLTLQELKVKTSKELEAKEAEIRLLQSKLSSIDKESTEQIFKIKQLQKEIVDSQTKISAAELKALELEKRFQRKEMEAERRTNDIKGELTNMKQKHDEVRADYESLQTEKETLLHRVDELQQRVEDLDQQQRDATETETALLEQIASLEVDSASLKQKNDESDQLLKNRMKQVTDLEALLQANSTLAEGETQEQNYMQKKLEDMQAENTELHSKCCDATEKLKEETKASKTSKAEIASVNQKLSGLEKQLKQARLAMTAKEKTLLEEASKYRQEAGRRAEEQAEQRQQLEVLEKDKQALLERINGMKTKEMERKELGDDLLKRVEQVEQVNAENRLLQETITNLRTEVSRLKQINDTPVEPTASSNGGNKLLNFLDSLETKAEEPVTESFQETIQEEKNDLDESGLLRLQNLETELTTLKAENQDLIRTIGKVNDEKATNLSELENENTKLKSTLEYVVEENENLKISVSDLRSSYEEKMQDLNETHEIIMEKLYNAMQAEEEEKQNCGSIMNNLQ